MREDRFFINTKIEKGKLEISEKEIFHQLKNVLRKRAGDKVILFNGTGIEAEVKIKKFLKDKVEVEILKIEKPERGTKNFCFSFLFSFEKIKF